MVRTDAPAAPTSVVVEERYLSTHISRWIRQIPTKAYTDLQLTTVKRRTAGYADAALQGS
jgi:hypothetical protein